MLSMFFTMQICKKNFITIGVTGIPGSGKTFSCQVFQKILKKDAKIFSADKIVFNIYQNSSKTKKLFSNFDWYKSVLDEKFTAKINKNLLIQKILERPEILQDLEKKFHPIVRFEFAKSILENKKYKYLIFEVPLLFETNFNNLFDLNITIESNQEKSLQKIKKKIPEELYKIFLDLHFSQEKKKKLSSKCFFNDFNNSKILEAQIKNFLEILEF